MPTRMNGNVKLIATLAIGVLGGVLAAGMFFGSLSTEVDALDERITIEMRSTDGRLGRMDKRLERIERQLDIVLTEVRK